MTARVPARPAEENHCAMPALAARCARTMSTIALLGTGLLGSGIAENLLAKGHTVRVWNRTPQKLAPLVHKGAVAGKDPADTVRGCERVHLVLAEDSAVDAVVAALRPGLGANVPVIDHSTNLPTKVGVRFAAQQKVGVRYVPAPVFMSPQNGREASGLMLLCGPKAWADELTPALSSMTGKLWYVGERPDLAAFLKLAGNGMLISMCGAVGDLLAMAKHNGVPAEQVVGLFDVFKAGAALPFFAQRVANAGDGPASFELSMARKDVRLMVEAAGGAPLIVLPGLAAAMDQALARGQGAADFAVFAKPK